MKTSGHFERWRNWLRIQSSFGGGEQTGDHISLLNWASSPHEHKHTQNCQLPKFNRIVAVVRKRHRVRKSKSQKLCWKWNEWKINCRIKIKMIRSYFIRLICCCLLFSSSSFWVSTLNHCVHERPFARKKKQYHCELTICDNETGSSSSHRIEVEEK